MELNIECISGLSIPVKVSESETLVIKIPELDGTSVTSWGDWGPMYRFQLSPTHPIQIEKGGVQWSLDQPFLEVESPILAQQRQETPFVINVLDPSTESSFHISLDKDFQVCGVRRGHLRMQQPQLAL